MRIVVMPSVVEESVWEFSMDSFVTHQQYLVTVAKWHAQNIFDEETYG
jgi:hypothetical protein